MLANYCLVELLKLRRSLALLLCVSAPIFVVVICMLIGLHDAKPMPLDRYAMTGAAFWAFAMLPMSVTALSVLMAQMEHGPRTWDHILTMPGARPRLFMAKALVMLLLVGSMSAWLYILLLVAARAVALVHPVSGLLNLTTLASTLGRMMLASVLMCMLQLWVALRFRSFVPPLVLGIVGTFIAVAAASARQGAYFPWLMPLHVLSIDPAMQRMALLIGSGGGIIALVAMMADLDRREA
ncbi:MAG: ABC transporter permease [Sphingomicrobium sp.]